MFQFKEAEEENSEYIRESIQSWDARSIFDNSTETVPDMSMSVYVRPQRHSQFANQTRYCRRCIDGKWEDVYVACPIEFSTTKCDPAKLRGVTYFVYIQDGAKLSRQESSGLVYPGHVAAVYEFGVQKYCKLCNSDGSWSSYPQFQLCELVKWT